MPKDGASLIISSTLQDPVENFTAVAWAERARESIAEIEGRGRRAILVGGSGFYLKALATRFFEAPEIEPGFRPRLERLRIQRGAAHLHSILERVDPETAKRYSARDWPRVIRALEVYFFFGEDALEVAEGVGGEADGGGVKAALPGAQSAS